MEIVFEILFSILYLLGELMLQFVFELLAEFGMHGFRKARTQEKPVHPMLATIGYIIFGGIAGWISLLLFPSLFISSPTLSAVNLALTPIIAGGAMAAVGTWRRKRGEELIRLDRFACGFMFALAMAVIRYVFASGA
jgi:hypothetical protein